MLGLDHHYESLPSLINPQMSLSLGQTAPVSAASQGVSNNPSGEKAESATLYKKFFSLPMLDSQEDYPGESEI